MTRTRLGARFGRLLLSLILGSSLLMFGVQSTAHAASSVDMHMHGGGGLTFVFYFEMNPASTLPKNSDGYYVVTMPTSVNGVSKATTGLDGSATLEYVEVYNGATLVDTIQGPDIRHRNYHYASLMDDGSMEEGVFQSNTGTINFWYERDYDEPTVTFYIDAGKAVYGNYIPDIAGLFEFEVYEFYGTDAQVLVATGTNNALGIINLDGILISVAGWHTYTVVEKNGGALTWDYDTSEYEVTINVLREGQALIIDSIDYVGGEIIFVNEYTPLPYIPVATVLITAQKTVEGANINQVTGWFDFVILDADEDVVAEGTNDSLGNVIFTSMEFYEAGTYDFTMKETNPDGNGWTNDKTVYNVRVDVVEQINNPDDPNDDTLSAIVRYYLPGSDNPLNEVIFNNIYDPGTPSPVEPILGPPVLPKTFDNLLTGLVVVGLLAAAGTALSFSERKPRKSQS